jgi:hypothetical protein
MSVLWDGIAAAQQGGRGSAASRALLALAAASTPLQAVCGGRLRHSPTELRRVGRVCRVTHPATRQQAGGDHGPAVITARLWDPLSAESWDQ